MVVKIWNHFINYIDHEHRPSDLLHLDPTSKWALFWFPWQSYPKRISVRFVLNGENPYSVDYSKTPMALWPFRIGNIIENPALTHSAYLPLTFLLPYTISTSGRECVGMVWPTHFSAIPRHIFVECAIGMVYAHLGVIFAIVSGNGKILDAIRCSDHSHYMVNILLVLQRWWLAVD